MPMTPTPIIGPSLSEHRAGLQRLAVEGGELAYLDTGPTQAEPILLLHGIPTSSWLYRRIAPRLAADGLRAIAPDLLGFGASDKPTGRDIYSPRHQGERLVALLDHLELEQATLVVHDAGGPWGFEIIERHPQRVAGLVVLNTTAYADAFTPPREVRALGGLLGPTMLRLMRSRLGKSMVHKMISDLTHTGKALDRAATEPHWQALREGSTTALRAFAQNLAPFTAHFSQYADALRRADIPASLIWGTHDPVLHADRLTPRFTEDLGLEPGDIHLLERASHFLQEDRPDDIADLISHFVHQQVIPRRPAPST
jgi:pimeloyl-ACP methyl ester carboxylesterase